MTLNQIFTRLLAEGYDRYVIDDNDNPHGTKMTCFLFKPGEKTPSIVGISATEKYALEDACKVIREPGGATGWKQSNAKRKWNNSNIED